MNIKTVTGPNIQAALAEARRQLGDNVLLLESIPAEGDRPATIKVVLDPSPTAPVGAGANARTHPEPVGYGYGAQQKIAASSRVDHAPPIEPLPTLQAADGHGSSLERRPLPRVAGGDSKPRSAEHTTVGRQLDTMQRRLRALERSVAVPSATPSNWRSMKLLRQLAGTGLRESTLTRLYARVRSFRADTGLQDGEMVLVRNELRRMLQMPVLRPAPAALLVAGSSGSGKTSLLLRLALHEEYFGRRRTAVVVIQPEQPISGYFGLIERYRQGGIPVQSVHTREEMRQALDRVERFDHLLIDTPSLPVNPVAATAFAEKIHEIVQDVVPLHVQLVLDASRVVSDDTLEAWKSLPLRPSSAAVTHLDEAYQWGRFAESLMRLALPYGYAADGAAVPDLSVLSASRIAEHLCTFKA